MPDKKERINRKNDQLHQSKIDRAENVPGATETETIERAPDLVAFGEKLLSGVDGMRGKRLQDIYAADER
jgi:hypothetical protein